MPPVTVNSSTDANLYTIQASWYSPNGYPSLDIQLTSPSILDSVSGGCYGAQSVTDLVVIIDNSATDPGVTATPTHTGDIVWASVPSWTIVPTPTPGAPGYVLYGQGYFQPTHIGARVTSHINLTADTPSFGGGLWVTCSFALVMRRL
jgi:hypothetical protein